MRCTPPPCLLMLKPFHCVFCLLIFIHNFGQACGSKIPHLTKIFINLHHLTSGVLILKHHQTICRKPQHFWTHSACQKTSNFSRKLFGTGSDTNYRPEQHGFTNYIQDSTQLAALFTQVNHSALVKKDKPPAG